MKKIAIIISAIAITIIILALNAFAATATFTKFTPTGASYGNSKLSVSEGAKTVVLEAVGIKDEIVSLLGENGGEVTLTVNYSASYTDEDANKIKCRIEFFNSSQEKTSITKKLSAKDMERDMELIITFSNIDYGKLAGHCIDFYGVSIEATPAETPTPSESASPTASESASPSVSPDLSPSVSPSISASVSPSVTPTPTHKSGTQYDNIVDNYSDNGKVTNPPPGIADGVDQTVIDALSTPIVVAEDSSTVTADFTTEKKTDKKLSSIAIFFIVLLLLIGADLAVIFWRKNLGFSKLVNGGVIHRRVNDNLYEEAFEPADKEDFAVYEDSEENDNSDVVEDEKE